MWESTVVFGMSTCCPPLLFKPWDNKACYTPDVFAVFSCYLLCPYAFHCHFQVFSTCGMFICHFVFQYCPQTDKFSIGLRSGLLPGQSNFLIFFFWRKLLTNFERWQGAPSRMNILHSWKVMWISRLSSSILRYLTPFIVVPGGKKKGQLCHYWT